MKTRWSKILKLDLYCLTLFTDFEGFEHPISRSADYAVLRMTHFAGKNRGKTKIAIAHGVSEEILNLSRN